LKLFLSLGNSAIKCSNFLLEISGKSDKPFVWRRPLWSYEIWRHLLYCSFINTIIAYMSPRESYMSQMTKWFWVKTAICKLYFKLSVCKLKVFFHKSIKNRQSKGAFLYSNRVFLNTDHRFLLHHLQSMFP